MDGDNTTENLASQFNSLDSVSNKVIAYSFLVDTRDKSLAWTDLKWRSTLFRKLCKWHRQGPLRKTDTEQHQQQQLQGASERLFQTLSNRELVTFTDGNVRQQ